MAFRSVRRKILASLFFVTLLFCLGMIVFAKTTISNKLHEKLQEKGVVLAKRVAADCVNPAITERYFEITMLLKDLVASEHDVIYAYVLNEEGRDIAHTFAHEVPRELKLAHQADMHHPFSTKDLTTDKGTVHDIAVPLLQGEVGVLHLGFSGEAIMSDVGEIVKAIVLFALVVLLFGSIVSFVFSRAITLPLITLTAATESFGRGDLPRQLVISSNDEIGELAMTFNAMIEKRQQIEAEREALILDLQAALSKVKLLSGFLPICASCKMIRDDQGYWNQIESYISKNSEAVFSHGLCPDCVRKLYPQFSEEIMEKLEGQKEMPHQ